MNIEKYFPDKDMINIVFLGGSITEGAGSSDRSKCFANMTGEWFKSVLGTDRVRYYNKGVGGTSSAYGLLRFERDVAAYSPDMVFIEFAVNDSDKDTRRFVEGIVRSILRLPDVPYVVFLYTTNEIYTTKTNYFEEIASYYGIPQIFLRDALKKHLCGKNAHCEGFMCDSVHPSDKGYEVYYKEMVRCLSKGEYYKKPYRKNAKLVQSSLCISSVFTPVHNFAKAGSWESGGEGERQFAVGKVGSTLEFEFDGTILAFEHGLHMDSAAYEIFADGKKAGYADAARPNFLSNQLVMGYHTFDLSPGRHEIKLKVVKGGANCGKNDRLLLYNVITGYALDD